MQITTHYNSGVQKSISEHTTRQTSKWMRLQQQKTNKSKKPGKFNKYANKVLTGTFEVHRTLHYYGHPGKQGYKNDPFGESA